MKDIAKDKNNSLKEDDAKAESLKYTTPNFHTKQFN